MKLFWLVAALIGALVATALGIVAYAVYILWLARTTG